MSGERRDASIQASRQPKNSSPRPTRWPSYQPYASAMSCSASGATTRSAAIAATNPSLDLFPTQARCRVLHEIRLATGEFLHLPVMNRHCLRARCNVVPQIFYELELLRRAE